MDVNGYPMDGKQHMNKHELPYDGNSGFDHQKWVFNGI
jgi:hypothetical protein